MRTRLATLLCVAAMLAVALGPAVAYPVGAAGPVLVYKLQPDWLAPGGGGVFSAYIGPPSYGFVSPGTTAVYDGRAAGIIKAGLDVDPTTGVHKDEGLFGFKPTVTIDALALMPLTYDVQNQYGENSVWMTIEIDTGTVGNRSDNTTYEHVPTTNPAAWHTVNAGAGQWRKWNNNQGDVTGNPLISLTDVAVAHAGRDVVRAYLRLGMGDSYHGSAGLGTVAWVDKATVGGVEYDFVVTSSTTVEVTPADPHGWYFYDDGHPGGVGTFVTGPGTLPAGTGSAQMVLTGTTQRETLTTLAYAGTRFDQMTKLEYYTYGSVANVQFNVDFDLTDANEAWMGRLVWQAPTGGSGWTKWEPMTGTWYASSAAGGTYGTLCPQNPGCTWAQVLSNYPNAGIRRLDGGTHLKANANVGFNGNVDAFTMGVNYNSTTYDFEPGAGGAALTFLPEASWVKLGDFTIVGINLNNVVNLYGYQFKVSYNDGMADAQAWFGDASTNGNAVSRPVYLPAQQFLKTASDATIPWNAVCASGMCKFSVSKTAGAGVSPVSGSGLLAYVVLTGHTAGTFNLTFSDDMLATIDGVAIDHSTGTAAITVYGTATVQGTVNLQGRTAPTDEGTVTLTDQSGMFLPVTVDFNATTGAFTASVMALLGGSNYTVVAAHALYLSNWQTGVSVTPGSTASLALTTLKGGDANSEPGSVGVINIMDLSTIGSAFGGMPGGGIGTGADINHDNIVNILDLVLAGGNYGLTSPQGW
jgi:hypothetical protein